MTNRSTLLVQLMDKIGAPLLAAIESFRAADNNDDKGLQDAQTMAALLGRAVEMGVNLSQKLDLSGSDEQDADSMRLALAAMAGPLIADIYKSTRKVPNDNDVVRMNKAMESVLSFSDNFTPSAKHISRLKSLDNSALHADENQNTIYVLQALSPILSVVAEFPFGQTETNLIKDINTKLQRHANALMKSMLDDNEEDQPKARYVELMILKSLAQVYAETHRTFTAKLTGQLNQGDDIQTITMDDVWKNFDLKILMLQAVIQSSLDGNQTVLSGSSGVTPVDPVINPAQPTDIISEQVVPAQTAIPEQATPLPAQAPVQADGASGNPMAFFSKKPDTPAPPPQAAPSETTATNVPPSTPPITPIPPPTEIEQPPAASAPTQTPPAGEAKSNPMAFFKPGAKKEDDVNN